MPRYVCTSTVAKTMSFIYLCNGLLDTATVNDKSIFLTEQLNKLKHSTSFFASSAFFSNLIFWNKETLHNPVNYQSFNTQKNCGIYKSQFRFGVGAKKVAFNRTYLRTRKELQPPKIRGGKSSPSSVHPFLLYTYSRKRLNTPSQFRKSAVKKSKLR